jgi:hypothetical protein
VTAIVVKISDAKPLALPNTGSQQHYRFVRFGTPAASAGGTVYNPVRQKSDAEYFVLYAHKHNAIDNFSTKQDCVSSPIACVRLGMRRCPVVCIRGGRRAAMGHRSETLKLQPLKIFAAAGAACMLLQDDRDGSL